MRSLLAAAGCWAVLSVGCGGDEDCAGSDCPAPMAMNTPTHGAQTESGIRDGTTNGQSRPPGSAASNADPPGAAGAGPSPAGSGSTGASDSRDRATPAGGSAAGAPGPGADASVPVGDEETGPDAGPGTPDPATGPEASLSVWQPDPAWDCGMPDGIPVPADGELLFTVEVEVEVFELGQTQYGSRQILNASGGTVSGDGIGGEVLAGAYDYQLILDNGVVEFEQIGVLLLDGGNVFFRNCGIAPDIDAPARVVADFEAATRGEHAALNEGRYIAERTFDATQNRLVLKVYSHPTEVNASGDVLAIAPPSTTQRQQWECPEYTGQPGEVVYRESVGIGGSVSVGASKYGNRNIIPITGGSSRDRLPGEVLAGGADYQLSADEFFLDARYVIRSDDGVLVAVRNCGPASALVPTFETRENGPYAFLNQNEWLSSSPSISIGAVNLTIYERR